MDNTSRPFPWKLRIYTSFLEKDPSVRSVISRDYLMEKLTQDEETFLTLEERKKYHGFLYWMNWFTF